MKNDRAGRVADDFGLILDSEPFMLDKNLVPSRCRVDLHGGLEKLLFGSASQSKGHRVRVTRPYFSRILQFVRNSLAR